MSFRDEVHRLRADGLVARVWRPADLRIHLAGRFAHGTFAANPNNSSISRIGDWAGSSVRHGVTPWAWRVDRGEYELIVDPQDSVETQVREMRSALERAEELREPGAVEGDVPDADVLRAVRRAIPNGPGERLDGGALDLHRPRRFREGAASPGDSVRPSSLRAKVPNAIPVSLTQGERKLIEGLSTHQKADWIVRRHLAQTGEVRGQIREYAGSAALRVSTEEGGHTVEVVGTERPEISWGEFKVSSPQVHDSLESGDSVIYYVVNVSGVEPSIHKLKHGRDFELEPQPTWVLKPLQQTDGRHPLRGLGFSFRDPFEPVAVDEWGAGQ